MKIQLKTLPHFTFSKAVQCESSLGQFWPPGLMFDTPTLTQRHAAVLLLKHKGNLIFHLRKTGITCCYVYLELLLPLLSFLLLLLGCSFNFHSAMLSKAKREGYTSRVQFILLAKCVNN